MAAIVHPRRTQRDRPRADGHFPGAPLAVAHDQRPALAVAFVAMRSTYAATSVSSAAIEHPARSLPGNLVEQGSSPVHRVLRRLVADNLQHGHRLFLPARREVAAGQAGTYAGGVTGSTIYNFRSSLSRPCHRWLAPQPSRPLGLSTKESRHVIRPGYRPASGSGAADAIGVVPIHQLEGDNAAHRPRRRCSSSHVKLPRIDLLLLAQDGSVFA